MVAVYNNFELCVSLLLLLRVASAYITAVMCTLWCKLHPACQSPSVNCSCVPTASVWPSKLFSNVTSMMVWDLMPVSLPVLNGDLNKYCDRCVPLWVDTVMGSWAVVEAS